MSDDSLPILTELLGRSTTAGAIVDARRALVDANEAFAAAVGVAPTHVRGRVLAEVSPGLAAALDDALEAAIQRKVIRRALDVEKIGRASLFPVDRGDRRFVVLLLDRDDADSTHLGYARFLADASAELAASLDYAATLDRVARLAVPAIADGCAIDVLEGALLTRVACVQNDPSRDAWAEKMRALPPPPPDAPVHRVLQLDRGVLVTEFDDETMQKNARGAEHLAILRGLAPSTGMILPMRVRGRPIGLVWLWRTAGGTRYDARDLALGEDLARRGALAIENARLYDAAKRSNERLALVAEASEVLAASLEPDKLAKDLATLLVPRVADACVVELREEEGEGIVVAATAPEGVTFERAPGDGADTSACERVMRIEQPLLLSEIHPDRLEGWARADVEFLRARAARSLLVVPLRTNERTIGAITLVASRDGLRYGEADLRLVSTIAARAALAITHARLYHHAREASRAKDEFLGTVSHELRTPLTAILGWAHLLKKRKDPESMARGLEIIQRNAKAQAQIIEDILDVSRIISGKLLLNVGTVDLAATVRAAVDVVRPQADAKEVALEVDIANDVPETTGDADRLQQVVWNLLANAVKFTPAKGKVSVSLRADATDAMIEVRDTGAGIAADFLPHVFERFRQADSSTSRAHGGLGLGLAIVRHLVEQHGGQVDAASEGRGKGAVFTVRIPLSAAETPRTTPVPSGVTPPITMARLDGLSVLVVDDEADAREMIRTVLADSGAVVRVAGSTKEALAALTGERAFRPDVLVSDIGMPGDDGYVLMRQVRKLRGEIARVPAIALTAYARADDARRAFLAGYQMHVPKPVEPAALTAVVANLGGRGG